MASLPENWEWDYDGKRWFYRYKPTGLIQYTFPKPGDEFPEFIDDTAAPLDLAPEEKLVSQQQVKRRSTLDKSSKPADTAKRRERAISNAVSEQEEGGGSFWFQPDGLMYMGPGAYNDISPLQEEEEERGGGSSTVEDKNDAIVRGTATVASTDVANATTTTEPPANEAPATHSQISPAVSAGTTPLVANSHTAAAAHELDSGVGVVASDNAPVDGGIVPSPDVPLLDSRQIPYNPIGVAELASESTPQCHEETNPAPVELPSNEMMLDTSDPVVYANAFHLAPAELPSDEVPAGRIATSRWVEPKSLGSQGPGQEQDSEEQRKAYQAMQELLNRPYKPIRQSSMPLAATSLAQTPHVAPEGRYQPYNPAKHTVIGAPAVNPLPTARSPGSGTARDNKIGSLARPALPNFRSDVPAALQPAAEPSRRSLEASSNGGRTIIPGPGAIAPETHGGLAHIPSVLQPARGRPVIRAQSPPESQGASPARTYQAYKPYRDLQKDIEDTVQLLSQTAYGQGPPAPPEPPTSGRPQVARTNTLPAHLPALPYMGAPPQVRPSSVSQPVTFWGLQLQQAASGSPGGTVAATPEASTSMPQGYPVPLPPSDPDMPPPLNLSRKSPSPHSISPNVPSASTIPTATEPDPRHQGATPTPISTMIVSFPALASPGPESGTQGGTIGVEDRIETHGGQSGPAASSMPQQAAFEMEATQHPSQRTVPTQEAQPQQPPSKQPISGGSSATVDRSVPAATAAPAPSEPSTVRSENKQPTPPTPFAVEVADVPRPSNSAAVIHSTQPSQHVVVSTSDTSSQPVASEVRTIESRQPEALPPDPREQATGQAGDPQSDPTASGVGQNSSHVISVYQPVIEVQHQSPPPPSAVSSLNRPDQNQAPSLSSTVLAPPAVFEGHQPSLSRPSNDVEAQQVATPPPPSVTPRAPSPQTPSPVSRASSPPSSVPPVTNLTAPVYVIPAGHHPLGSHPVNVAQSFPPGPPRPPKIDLPTNAPGGQQQPQGPPRPPKVGIDSQQQASEPTAPAAQPQAPPPALSNTGNIQATETSHQPPPQAVRAPSPESSKPAPPNPSSGHGSQASVTQPTTAQPAAPAAPLSTANQGQMASQPPPRQAGAGAAQIPPQRTFSHPVISQSGPPIHPGAPGTAPPQMMMMFAPPAVPPGIPQQGVPSGIIPQQQFAFQPVMHPQAGMQHQPMQPMAPHMVPPSQMPYVMQQQPQQVQPVKEEPKGWFGKLWRSESVRKLNPATSASAPNKLQKGARPPSQMSPAFPPQPNPSQPFPQPHFVRGQQNQVPPQMMIMVQPAQQAQQQGQAQPIMQQPPQQQQQAAQQPQGQPQQQAQSQPRGQQQHPQIHQQQQQQTLAWKSNGNGTGASMPQFHAPNHNPSGKPVMPPPHVRQAIQQQVQHLPQQGGQAVQGGQPVQQGGEIAAQGVQPVQGGRAEVAEVKGMTSGSSTSAPAGSGGAGGWGKGNAWGYDGSGWGDDDGDYQ
ncbi:hypothetical protein VTI74DRAFT_11069 [Chaetomium olivicolor]